MNFKRTMKRNLLITAAILLAATLSAASPKAGKSDIDRRLVVGRNNPLVQMVDTMAALTVGNGHIALTVDATGLQTFPEHYRNGTPLGTMSDWGWHAFPNTEGYRPEETLADHNFHRGRGDELYAVQFRQPGRQKEASDYFRANPHRLHLGCMGFSFDSPKEVKNIKQLLDLWNGEIKSHFTHEGKAYDVKTFCLPHRDKFVTNIKTQGGCTLRFRVPYPTGAHTDDGCNWASGTNIRMEIANHELGNLTLAVSIDTTTYYVRFTWTGRVKLAIPHFNELCLTTPKNDFTLAWEFLPEKPKTEPAPTKIQGHWKLLPATTSFTTLEQQAAAHWNQFWSKGGIVDFSRVPDSRARELERRVVLSQYLLAVNDGGNTPPQETGLTYNSWFGKFHLEMTWWHLAPFALWGHPELLDRCLSWYATAEPMAREIARRQGFKGVRWMKMTDPSATEAPSNVGSYLIWQQPHLIYLAELLYRAAPTAEEKEQVVEKYGRLVEETADFMADFAELDNRHGCYILRGCIPAQETLNADSVVNPPFELNYWQWGLTTAQRWRERQRRPRQPLWDDIIARLSPLADQDGVYLTAETAPLPTGRAEQTDNPKGIDRFASDHPMPLGALGMLPASRLVDKAKMHKTFRWIADNWNWQKTWGWDYPMTAMCAARLGLKEQAVDALLMNRQKNTYLANGHNYQDNRLRIYLPGNGGLLTAIAMMAAGWDGAKGRNPGFPDGWDVRWEGLLPMP